MTALKAGTVGNRWLVLFFAGFVCLAAGFVAGDAYRTLSGTACVDGR